MKTRLNAFLAMLLSISLILPMLPFMALPVKATNESTPITITDNYREKWTRLETDLITILFPTNGSKPMFLWWYSDDTENVYVMKYKGLIEYLTFDAPYYLRVNQALEERIRERLQAGYIEPHEAMWALQIRNRIRERLLDIAWLYDLHPPLLPFAACRWELSGPELMPKGDNIYCVSFNFTLKEAPSRFSFAEENVIIRCRFYNGSVTEDAGTYEYTVEGGQMKMDLVVKNWTWNMDLLQPFFEWLEQYDVTIPPQKTGLALWINLASINIVDLENVEKGIGNPADDTIEALARIRATASNMIFNGRRHRFIQNDVEAGMAEAPITLRHRLREHLRLHFAKEDEVLAGFFSFVSTANIIDAATEEISTVDVTASYIAAGGHMRLFLCYPYFGDDTLEHDPVIGAEYVPPFITSNQILALILLSGLIVAILGIAKWKRKPINIVGAA